MVLVGKKHAHELLEGDRLLSELGSTCCKKRQILSGGAGIDDGDLCL